MNHNMSDISGNRLTIDSNITVPRADTEADLVRAESGINIVLGPDGERGMEIAGGEENGNTMIHDIHNPPGNGQMVEGLADISNVGSHPKSKKRQGEGREGAAPFGI